MHFVFYRYCCEGQCPVSNHLKCPENSGIVGEFDRDWRLATVKSQHLRHVASLHIIHFDRS